MEVGNSLENPLVMKTGLPGNVDRPCIKADSSAHSSQSQLSLSCAKTEEIQGFLQDNTYDT